MNNARFRFAEFFAGGGMARMGLGSQWDCALANDIDPVKCEAYRNNWGNGDLVEGDIADLRPVRLCQPIDLYWASSPCQDFSLAGKGAGLDGNRSGVFHTWYNLLSHEALKDYRPRLIAFENVVGLATRNGGADLAAIVQAFQRLGYKCGALELDACDYLPQSRPRLFLIAARGDLHIPTALKAYTPGYGHSPKIQKFYRAHERLIGDRWVWWQMPFPEKRNADLSALVDDCDAQDWFPAERVEKLLSIMSPLHLERVRSRQNTDNVSVGTLYKRGRPIDGQVRQRAEVRFDGTAGCLRTPAGGSSRQTVVFVGRGEVKARLLTTREAARLMGLPDDYELPARYNDAYKLMGDGVAVPVVRRLAETIFEPLLNVEKFVEAA